MTDTITPSVLTSTKKLLGITELETSFDVDVVIGINSAFMVLNQLGVGPTTAYSIVDKTNLWSEFLQTSSDLEAVKTYIYLKTRMFFDPPTSGILVEAMKSMIAELEFRLNVQAEPRTLNPVIIEEE